MLYLADNSVAEIWHRSYTGLWHTRGLTFVEGFRTVEGVEISRVMWAQFIPLLWYLPSSLFEIANGNWLSRLGERWRSKTGVGTAEFLPYSSSAGYFTMCSSGFVVSDLAMLHQYGSHRAIRFIIIVKEVSELRVGIVNISLRRCFAVAIKLLCNTFFQDSPKFRAALAQHVQHFCRLENRLNEVSWTYYCEGYTRRWIEIFWVLSGLVPAAHWLGIFKRVD